jgi:hypothetical protein
LSSQKARRADEAWSRWYMALREDKIARRLGILREDEGILGPEDKIDLMLKRGMTPAERPTEESVSRRMGLPLRRKEETKK